MLHIDRLVERGSRASLLMTKRLRHALGGAPAGRNFVFVAGMQRSGTNMVMDVFERSFDTDVYHESDPRAFDNYEMRAPEVISALAERSQAPFFVIKALCELDLLPDLMQRFAPSRTLWILRDYQDVVNSAVRSFKHFPRQIGRLVENKTSAQWRGRGMSDETQQRLRALYHPEMNEETAAALTWYYRNVLYFENGLDRRPDVRLVCYESLVSSPERAFRDIFAFLGIPFSARISSIVTASSVRKNPSPSIAPEVRVLCDELVARFSAAAETRPEEA